MNKLISPVLGVVVAALGVALLFSHTKQSAFEQENASLRKQLEALTASQPVSTAPSAAGSDPANNTRESTDTELVRLRGEITNLRRVQQELQKLRAENQTLRARNESRSQSNLTNIAVPKSLPRESWTFSGFANPESAIQSLLWAGASGDAATALAALTPEQLARMKAEDNKNRSEEEVLADLTKQVSKIRSYQVLESRNISENESVLTLFIDGLEGSERLPALKMQRINNEWRLAGPYNPQESKQQ